MTESALVVAAGLGLAYAAAPGAVNAEAIRRGVSHGFRPAVLVQVGSLLGDVGWAALALAGLAVVLRDTALRATLGVAGAAVLSWFAWTALRGAATPGGEPESAEAAARVRGLGAFATGVLLSVANPVGPVFWLGVGGGLTAGGVVGQTTGDAIAFLLAFVLGALSWGVGMGSLLAFARRRATSRLFRVVDVVCGVAFGYFAIRLLAESIGALRGG